MLVSKTLETPEGTVKFEGELTQEEANLVIECGLSFLFQAGAFPIMVKKLGLETPTQEQ